MFFAGPAWATLDKQNAAYKLPLQTQILDNLVIIINKKRRKSTFYPHVVGSFTILLPVVSRLTLYPLEVLLLNSCYLHLTAVKTKQNNKKNIRSSLSLSRSLPSAFTENSHAIFQSAFTYYPWFQD